MLDARDTTKNKFKDNICNACQHVARKNSGSNQINYDERNAELENLIEQIKQIQMNTTIIVYTMGGGKIVVQ